MHFSNDWKILNYNELVRLKKNNHKIYMNWTHLSLEREKKRIGKIYTKEHKNKGIINKSIY